MPIGICKKCKHATNSCTSNYWSAKDNIPTECYGSFVDGKWVKGCAYDLASEFNKSFVNGLIKNSKEKG